MAEARELFIGFAKDDSGIHIELGDDSKFALKGQGIIQF